MGYNLSSIAYFYFVLFFFVKMRLKSLLASASLCLALTLPERLRTHKVFTKDQCFHLNYHMFSIKSYVLDVY